MACAAQVGSNTSDLQELTGGLPHVFVAVPDGPDSAIDESKLNGADKVRCLGVLSELDSTCNSVQQTPSKLHPFATQTALSPEMMFVRRRKEGRTVARN